MSAPPAVDRPFLEGTLRELVRIDSVNPALEEGGAGEGEIARRVAEILAGSGLEAHLYEHAPGRVSAVGRLPGRGGGRSLMLNAHLDTVGAGGMAEPFAAAVRDGRLYGRGAYDMKGSLAACLAAARALAGAPVPLAGDLVVAAVADEEHASLGTRELISHYPVDGAIVTEPTGLRLCRAHKGFVWLRVETLGRAAHGSRHQEGIDANLRMGRVLAELERLEAELRRRPSHPLVGRPSLHAATLQGGTALSVYAARSTLGIERRTIPGETEEGARSEIQGILDRLAAADPQFEARLETLLVREPFEAPADAPLVRALEGAAGEVLGRPPEHVGETPWMDAALLAGAGVDTAVLGPAGAGAHADEEWVDLESVAQLAAVLVRVAMRYCNGSAARSGG